jgi:hypothetical protein
MPSPLCFETTSDAGNLVKVRGVVLDNRGFPTGHPVAYNKVVSATVLAGVCPVTRTGRVLPPGEMKVQRRKSTVSEGAYEAVSRMSSMVPPSNASLAESPLPNGANAYDLPVSYHLDAPYDWTSCKATHRQNNFTELPDGLFSVTVPGEPAVLIFSRRSPSNTASGNSTSMRLGRGSTTDGNSGRPPSAGKAAGGKVNSSGLVWLVEVQYFFRLETGQVRILMFLRCLPLILTVLMRKQAIFVPMPPHIYGELTRTMEGCEVLAKRKVVSDLLSRAHQLFNVCTMVPATGRANGVTSEQDKRAEMTAAYKDLQAALWALGHIGSNELGCALILEADKKFVPWCIESVYSCPYYSLRGTFFYVLGLLSRTQQGSRRLLKFGWDSAPKECNSAVAFPLRASNLFRNSGVGSISPTSPRSQGSPANKFPFTVGPPPTSPLSRTASGKGGAFTAPTTSAFNHAANGAGPNAFQLAISTASPLPPRNAALSPSHMGVMSPPRVNTLPESVLSHLNVYNRTSLALNKNMDIEVLHLIAKVCATCLRMPCRFLN